MVDVPPASSEELVADRLLTVLSLVRRRTRRVVGGPFAAEGLTAAQGELVRFVRRNPGVSIKQAAQALGLAPNTVSTLVAGLVEAGILSREQDPADLRVARLDLTDRARAPLDAWRSRRLETVGAAVAALDSGQREALDAGLDVLHAIAEALGGLPDD